MQYFKLFDDLAPEGDLYRWDGKNVQMRNDSGTWGYEHGPEAGETLDQFLSALVGDKGAYEEVFDFQEGA